MTPKEKAQELFFKMQIDNFSLDMCDDMAKHCSIVAVDEVIDACEYNEVESYNTDWWNKVKQELEKL
jgi:hypothetical protein